MKSNSWQKSQNKRQLEQHCPKKRFDYSVVIDLPESTQTWITGNMINTGRMIYFPLIYNSNYYIIPVDMKGWLYKNIGFSDWAFGTFDSDQNQISILFKKELDAMVFKLTWA
jgi:hypothetical protein